MEFKTFTIREAAATMDPAATMDQAATNGIAPYGHDSPRTSSSSPCSGIYCVTRAESDTKGAMPSSRYHSASRVVAAQWFPGFGSSHYESELYHKYSRSVIVQYSY
eukprot:6447384-Pyramimonas_sp.AAC.1